MLGGLIDASSDDGKKFSDHIKAAPLDRMPP